MCEFDKGTSPVLSGGNPTSAHFHMNINFA